MKIRKSRLVLKVTQDEDLQKLEIREKMCKENMLGLTVRVGTYFTPSFVATLRHGE